MNTRQKFYLYDEHLRPFKMGIPVLSSHLWLPVLTVRKIWIFNKLTRHFWKCICCFVMPQVLSIWLAAFLCASSRTFHHRYGVADQNQRSSLLCSHPEEHYELQDHDEQILYWPSNPGRNAKENWLRNWRTLRANRISKGKRLIS